MRTLKFGGSTLKSAANCEKVVAVVQQASRRESIIVVVSALYGVTEQLIALITQAESHRSNSIKAGLKKIAEIHHDIISKLIPKKNQTTITQELAELLSELAELYDGIGQLQECSARTRDRVIGYGELLSSRLIAALLSSHKVPALAVDARHLIETDDSFGNANVQMKATAKHLKLASKAWKGLVPVVTGFVASTSDGVPTTVGRNGSDYTAAIVGALLNATEIEIWSDVNGVLSADPRYVDDAFPLQHLSYAEAMEMAYFGAKVLHPRTVIPAVDAKIPLRMRNILDPHFPGTVISAACVENGACPIKGIASIPDVSLISLQGAGMIGVVGVAARMFDALARAHVNVVLISQGSSEQSICCVVHRADTERGCAVLRDEFESEFRHKSIRQLHIRNDIVVIAAVGTGMQGTPGVAGKLFGALGKNHVNVIAVAQGSSEQNISIVIPEPDHMKALNVIHSAFHLATRHAHVVVIGKGAIGSTLIEQIAAGQKRLEKNLDLRLKIVGIANRKHFLFQPQGITLNKWQENLAQCRTPMKLGQLAQTLEDSHLANIIIVDATADEAVAKQFPSWLSRGFSVVTPNKKANTLSTKFYTQLQDAARNRNAYYYYEACVGAGLPIISTLQDLLNSGDEIIHIEGLLSGTLGYLFSELESGKAFSAIVKKAHEMRYTEPDPRDDLSGMDVARKLVILARLCGVHVELSQVKIDPLLPKSLWQAKTVAEFFKKLPQVDNAYEQKMAVAAKAGNVLRYIGRIKNGKCRIELKAVPKNSAFGNLVGGDNMVIFTTKRYLKNPLIVRGPGAGPEVTAGGVFADILKVANLLTS